MDSINVYINYTSLANDFVLSTSSELDESGDTSELESENELAGGDRLKKASSLLHKPSHEFCKAEIKARKKLSKLDIKPVEGITRVTLQKSKKSIIIIDKPEVYKVAKTDTYLIFGDSKVEDLHNKESEESNETSKSEILSNLHGGGPTLVSEGSSDETDVDEIGDANGLDKWDVNIVMSQASVTREQAMKSLRKNRNDVFNTIMDLTV